MDIELRSVLPIFYTSEEIKVTLHVRGKDEVDHQAPNAPVNLRSVASIQTKDSTLHTRSLSAS